MRQLSNAVGRIRIVLMALVSMTAWVNSAKADGFGPETCKQGFVWREACGPNDHVCVAPGVRAQALSDNGQAARGAIRMAGRSG